MNIGLFILFGIIIAAVVTFCVVMLKRGNVRLIHKLYFIISGITVLWLFALMNLLFFKCNPVAEYIIDSITNLAVFVPVLMLLVSFTFIWGWEKLPPWSWWLFVIPAISFMLIWTNPLHHLYYKVFSLNIVEIEFSPYFYLNGIYSYLCLLLSAVFIVYFAFKSKRSIHTIQAALFAAGNILALIASILATSGIFGLTIYSTPFTYIFSVVLMHGLAIFRFHMLDIKPIAVETVLDRISDGYLVVSDEGIVVSHNRAFADTIGAAYGLSINTKIQDCVSRSDLNDNVGIHTLLSSMKSCEESETTISYEQSLTLCVDGAVNTVFYMVDVTVLKVGNKNVGFVIFFKDISKLKESIRNLDNSQKRLMENERLATLGQMMGGISHNLKTPIMSISGSLNAVDKLIDESISSIDDPEVGREDYLEIYSEMRQWMSRIQEACSYMSDIISAVKGQAANLNANSDEEFTMDDVIKRVTLLLRHELQSHNCSLKVNNLLGGNIKIRGDINSMVQVVDNLVGNSVDAMKETGGDIEIELDKDDKNFLIRIKDRGPGVPDEVKPQLFTKMVTTKGAMGSGLGIYMSNSFIKARFDGSICYEDNPDGGAIFVISIPINNIEADLRNYNNTGSLPTIQEE